MDSSLKFLVWRGLNVSRRKMGKYSSQKERGKERKERKKERKKKVSVNGLPCSVVLHNIDIKAY